MAGDLGRARTVRGGSTGGANAVSAGIRPAVAPARASVVTLAYVEGVEITALCGVRFSPHRDPDRFEEWAGLRCGARVPPQGGRKSAPRRRSVDTCSASCPSASAVFSSGGSFTSFDADATTLAQDRHHGLGLNAKQVADGKAGDAPFLAEPTEMDSGHSEEVRRFRGGQRLAAGDGGDLLATSKRVEGDRCTQIGRGGSVAWLDVRYAPPV